MYARKISVIAGLLSHTSFYPTPRTLTYNWSFGSIAGICLLMQIITGLFLSMHYNPSVALAFDSIEYIMRDVNTGWFVRYIHANGASLFFAILYLHIARSIYTRAFRGRSLAVWLVGVIIFLLVMATAFLGYILPWGQMSLWGATVITNLFSAIPVVGKVVVKWLWGGFSVDNPTLTRFYSLHYVLPFLIVILVFVHLIFLHWAGSTTTSPVTVDYITFMPYFYLKDLFSILVVGTIFMIVVVYCPEYLGHADNYIRANAMVTPAHIVPEWYFLPFYAILRSIPNKLAGVVLMFSAIIGLGFLPLFHQPRLAVGKRYKLKSGLTVSAEFINEFQYKMPGFWHRVSFGFFIGAFILLGWLGAQPAQEPYISVSLYLTFFYFFYLTFGQMLILFLDSYWIEFLSSPRLISFVRRK